MTAKLKRWRLTAAAGAILLVVLAPPALAMRTLRATDTAHLRYISPARSLLLEEGTASGTLPGKIRATVSIGPTISGTFTFYVHGATITGHGSAIPHGSGTYESFSGSLTVTGGTGRYAHVHGRSRLYGTFDRQTYDLVLQTTGALRY